MGIALIVICNKVEFRAKKITTDKEEHYIMIERILTRKT